MPCARLGRRPRAMFDLRYHVASLAAVFLALVIGILVGVGISDTGYVDKGYRGLLEQRIAKLQSDLSDAGASGWVRVRALKFPLDLPQIDNTLAGEPALARYVGDARLAALGKSLAEELAAGGKAPLWSTLAEEIVAERTGSEKRPADGVVVVRTAGKQYDGAAKFLAGFYSGLIAAPVPVVGVETTDASQSTVKAFKRNGLSTV